MCVYAGAEIAIAFKKLDEKEYILSSLDNIACQSF
jgi:hypothetical protein